MNNPLDARFLTLLAEVTLKSLVLFGIAFVTAQMLRRSSAFARVAIWKAVICSLLALPILCLVLPAWRVPFPVGAVISPLSPPASAEVLPLSTWEKAIKPPTPSAVTMEIAPAEPVVAPSVVEEATPAPIATEVLPPLPDAAKVICTFPIVLTIYLVGVGVVLLRLLAAFVRLAFLSRNSQHCTLPQIQSAGENAARKLGLSCSVSLRIALPASREWIPMTWGYWRPCVLLPTEAQDWDSVHLDAVLLHEIAHVARADWLMQQIGAVTSAFYWFHPLAWKAARLLKLECECACDETVVATGIAPTDYALVLLASARAHKHRAFSHEGSLSMAHTTNLSVRIRSLLDRNGSQRKPSRHAVIGFGMISLAGLLALSALHPADAAAPPETMSAVAAAPETPEVSSSTEPKAVMPPAETKSVVPPSRAFKHKTDSKAAAIMKQVEAKAKSVQSLIADVQMDHSFKDSPTERGTVRLMKPKLYRLQFRGTEENFVVSDGTAEWTKQPGSVYSRYAYNKGNDTHLPFPLGSFISPCVDYAPYVGGLGNSKTIYKGQRVEQGKRFDVVEVKRDKPGKGYIYRLYIGADKIIHRATLISKIGKPSQSDVRLSNIRLNPALSASDFQFTLEEQAQFSASRKPASPILASAPHAKPQTEFMGEISWSEVKDGIQTGLQFASEKTVYSINDEIKFRAVVRNVNPSLKRVRWSLPDALGLAEVVLPKAGDSSHSRGRFVLSGGNRFNLGDYVLPPGKILPLPIVTYLLDLKNNASQPLRSGSYTVAWGAQIEHFFWDKDQSVSNALPKPKPLTFTLTGAPGDKEEKARKQSEVKKNTRFSSGKVLSYGNKVHGVCLGVTLPRLVSKVAADGTQSHYTETMRVEGGRLVVEAGQSFRTDVFLCNTSDKPVTVLTSIPLSAELQSAKESAKLARFTLKPLEQKYLCSPEIQVQEASGQQFFWLNNAFDSNVFRLSGEINRNEYTVTLMKSIRFDGGESASLSTAGLRLIDLMQKPAKITPTGMSGSFRNKKVAQKLKTTANQIKLIMPRNAGIVYGEEVNGIQLGIRSPAMIANIKPSSGSSSPYVIASVTPNDRFVLPKAQSVVVEAYLRNNSSQPITLLTQHDSNRLAFNGEVVLKRSALKIGNQGFSYGIKRLRKTATRMTLQPFEERLVSRLTIRLEGHNPDPYCFHDDDELHLLLAQNFFEEQYELSLGQRILFKEGEEALPLSSGAMKFVDLPEVRSKK